MIESNCETNVLEKVDANKQFLFRFQQENTCRVSKEFLVEFPECLLNNFINLNNEEEDDDEIYIDYTVHYPELLISIIQNKPFSIPSESDIDASYLRSDFITLFPHQDFKYLSLAPHLCKPIFDYCSKSNDIICCCTTPEYSCVPRKDFRKTIPNNKIVDIMNFQDKYVYIVSGQLNDSKINELKQLSRFFAFFNFISISIQSTFTDDLDITTVVNNQYLTIFPNLPSLHIQFFDYKNNDIDVHEVSFNYKKKDDVDSKTKFPYLQLFKKKFYPSLKNMHFSNDYAKGNSGNYFEQLLTKHCFPNVECISISNLNPNNNVASQICTIIASIDKIHFPKIKKLSFQGNINMICMERLINSLINELFFYLQKIELDDFQFVVTLRILPCLQTLLDKGLTQPITNLSICCLYHARHNYNLGLYFNETPNYIQSDTIDDVIELFTPLVFIKLNSLYVNYNKTENDLQYILRFLSSSSYPALESLSICEDSFHKESSKTNNENKFKDINDQSIDFKMPKLNKLSLISIDFSPELLESLLMLFINKCPLIEQITFQKCTFQMECSDTLYNLASQRLLENIQFLEFDFCQINSELPKTHMDFFIPSHFINLTKHQLKSLKTLYYSGIHFTQEDFINYVNFYVKHIIPSTSLSLTDPTNISDAYNNSITVTPAAINFLFDSIQNMQLKHLTTISFLYANIPFNIFEHFSSYLTKQYLPNLCKLYMKLNCNKSFFEDVKMLMSHSELVIANQLKYRISIRNDIIENDFAYNNDESAKNVNFYSAFDEYIPIENKRNLPPFGTRTEGIKRNINNDDVASPPNDTTQEYSTNTQKKKNKSSQSINYNYGIKNINLEY
ncbi:hypothetical protein WA158_004333 [Blastocystis sp. Blastoise]